MQVIRTPNQNLIRNGQFRTNAFLCSPMVVISAKIPSFSPRKLRFPNETFWLSCVFFPLLFLGIFASNSYSADSTANNVVSPSPIAFEGDSTVTISISFIGDLMCHLPQTNNARKADGTYDFNPSFKEIAPYLSAADLTMGNLECTFAGTSRPYAGYPAFNSPDAYLEAIKNSGIDFLCTANNHSMDTGEEGLERTIKKVRENGFGSTGTFDSQRDRDSIRVLDVKGIRVAILNYTYGTNGAYPSANHKWMLNVADSALVHDDVLRARATNADVVIVFYHWGIEYKPNPVPRQDTLFHWAADAGADLVIGSHPHVIEPVGFFKTATNAKLDSGLVVWSLGNFISNQNNRYSDAGVIVNLSLQKNFNTGKISLEQTAYFPTWVYRYYDPSLLQHVVVPANWCASDSLPSWIGTESKRRMCEAFDDTKVMMEKNSAKMKLYAPVVK